jgi:hypothetical protein
LNIKKGSEHLSDTSSKISWPPRVFLSSLQEEIPVEAGGLTHPTSGLMKPGEGLAQILSQQEKLGVDKS